MVLGASSADTPRASTAKRTNRKTAGTIQRHRLRGRCATDGPLIVTQVVMTPQ